MNCLGRITGKNHESQSIAYAPLQMVQVPRSGTTVVHEIPAKYFVLGRPGHFITSLLNQTLHIPARDLVTRLTRTTEIE